MSQQPNGKRSFTGHHDLLPAAGARQVSIYFFLAPSTLLTWTLGRGTVFFRIWPAVLFHTAFAVGVTTVSMRSNLYLGIPNVMLTVLGVVIGFVISYRASSGYDRYWMGRTAWSEVIRNIRTLSRLTWFHIPLRLTPKATPTEKARSMDEIRQVMKEKRRALDLLEGFAVAAKHHLRNEAGIYYEDLYSLTRPFHRHEHHERARHVERTESPQFTSRSAASTSSLRDPIVPSINSYGATDTLRGRGATRNASRNSSNSEYSEHDQTPLLPASREEAVGLFSKVSADLIPFAHFFQKLSPGNIKKLFSTKDDDDPFENEGGVQRRWSANHSLSVKHRPRVACNGENVPLEIIYYLSGWFSELEDRGTVPGTSMGPMIGALASLEDNISTLERILTTPLPFVYAVHIRHTVWIFLFFLPFQLVDLFQWYTIPGVAIAAFIYLGFLAAGEEIEQPFGYDLNDLDLDMFCREIIHVDIERLKRTPGPNVFLGSHHGDHGEEHSAGKRAAETSNADGKQTEASH